jgi:hypothetical protein
MRLRHMLRSVGLVGAVIGLGAGLAVHVGGCAGDPARGGGPTATSGTQVSALPRLPSVDLAAPSQYQTASFAFG